MLHARMSFRIIPSTRMRLAAIDIGTNSVHMIVVRVRPDFSFEVVDREKEMVRLGAGGLDGKKLTPEAMAAALQALSRSSRGSPNHTRSTKSSRSPPARRAKRKTAARFSAPSSGAPAFARASSPAPKKRG